jgi:VIT1/CCC1 family predicted Fe2+/Mn2+ transporter
MSVGGRAQTRDSLLKRARLVAGALVLLTVLFLISSHWILAAIFAVGAAAAIWVFTQARRVR